LSVIVLVFIGAEVINGIKEEIRETDSWKLGAGTAPTG